MLERRPPQTAHTILVSASLCHAQYRSGQRALGLLQKAQNWYSRGFAAGARLLPQTLLTPQSP